METIDLLKQFLLEKYNYLDKIENLELTSAIEKDLGIYGDDAIEFILEYAKEFDVDISNFMAADYFSGEGVDIFHFFRRKKMKELAIGDLLKGIEAGKLDDSVINQ